MFMASFNVTIDSYRALLAKFNDRGADLVNQNFDTGQPTVAGQYVGADLTYDKLLDDLAGHKFAGVSADLRGNILDYYKQRMPPVSPATKKASEDWAKILAERTELEQLQPEVATQP
jgi:hypothetical protein